VHRTLIADLLFARDHQPPGRPWTWAERPGFEVFWGAPALAVVCGRGSNPEVPFDCHRAGRSLTLAAHWSTFVLCTPVFAQGHGGPSR
jgi:hypothetical protein